MAQNLTVATPENTVKQWKLYRGQLLKVCFFFFIYIYCFGYAQLFAYRLPLFFRHKTSYFLFSRVKANRLLKGLRLRRVGACLS